MRRYKYLIIFVLLVAAAFAAKFALVPDPFPKVGEYQVEVYRPAASRKFNELMGRVQSAIMADPAWYVEYMKANPEIGFGEILPYHENLGLSKKDYDLLEVEAGKARFEKAGTAKIRVTEGPGGSLNISIDAPGRQFKEFTLSPNRRDISGKFGTFGDDDEKAKNHTSRLLGKWRGRQWHIVSGEPSINPNAEFLQLDVGVGVDEENRRIVFLTGGGRQGGQAYVGDFLFRWPDA